MTGTLRNIEGSKRGENGQGKKRQKLARGAGLQGPRGTMVVKSRAAKKLARGQNEEAGRRGCLSICRGNPSPEEKG